jgi:hypothetical protein
MLMPSSVIRRFVYDPAARELWIEFVTGRRYVYEDVPDEIAQALGSAPSKGAYFNICIRDHFEFREVTKVRSATES